MFKYGVLGEMRASGAIMVFCGRCHGDIGTMTLEIMRAAVHATSDRGGVLCPDCRQSSCYQCGSEMTSKGVRNCWICAICLLDDVTVEDEVRLSFYP